ncbi:MAG: hypothetical protein KDB68_17495 [Planctomycetes bacterium]|nr:hypothetical protein [Planctomycetota bacterium]
MGMAAIVALLGCVLVAVASALFFPNAPELPVLSEGDWPRLIVMFLGAGWSLLGTVQYLRYGKGFMAKSAMILMLLFSLGGTGVMSYFVLDYTYDLPTPVEMPADKPIPAFELADQNGELVSDVSLRGKPHIIFFARGVF